MEFSCPNATEFPESPWAIRAPISQPLYSLKLNNWKHALWYEFIISSKFKSIYCIFWIQKIFIPVSIGLYGFCNFVSVEINNQWHLSSAQRWISWRVGMSTLEYSTFSLVFLLLFNVESCVDDIRKVCYSISWEMKHKLISIRRELIQLTIYYTKLTSVHEVKWTRLLNISKLLSTVIEHYCF